MTFFKKPAMPSLEVCSHHKSRAGDVLTKSLYKQNNIPAIYNDIAMPHNKFRDLVFKEKGIRFDFEKATRKVYDFTGGDSTNQQMQMQTSTAPETQKAPNVEAVRRRSSTKERTVNISKLLMGQM